MENINDVLIKEYKNKKIGIILLIIFSFLFASSLTLLLIFSDWRYQLLFQIVGSVFLSIISCAFLYCFLFLLKPALSLINKWSKLNSYQEKLITLEINKISNVFTSGDKLKVYKIEGISEGTNKIIYVDDYFDSSNFILGCKNSIIIKDSYFVGWPKK